MSTPVAPIPTDELLTQLRTGEMHLIQRLPWSSNTTFFVQIESGGQQLPAIYKPRRGERPLWDFPQGTLFRREVAAFEVSHALGWQIVPPTVARQGSHGIGMVQLFIPHDPDEHFFAARDPWSMALTRIALFDVIINNADRKGGHMLRDETGHIWGIDHGVSFHEEAKLRTVVWELSGQPIPTSLIADMELLAAHLHVDEALHKRLITLLSPREVEALHQRLEATIDIATFPLPPQDRYPVPWPMI